MHIQLDKIEELIRVGLLPVSSLPVLKRALGYVERGMVLPTQERNAVYDFMEKFMGKVLKDPTLFRMFKQKISTSRTMKEEQMHEASTGVKQSSGMSDDLKAQVAADIAKRKAKKAEALKSAAKEMEGWKPDKKDVRKIYQKEEVEQLDEGNPENKAKKNAYVSSVGTASAQKSFDKAKAKGDKYKMQSLAPKLMSSRLGNPEAKEYMLRRGRKKLALRKESLEHLDELSKPTLKKYVAKATKSADKAWEKADKEEDKSMSTDGNKYPEKQKRHMDNARKHIDKWGKRTKGIEQAKMKLREMLGEANKAKKNAAVDKIGKANPATGDVQGYVRSKLSDRAAGRKALSSGVDALSRNAFLNRSQFKDGTKKMVSQSTLARLKAQKKPNLPESVVQEEIELQKAPEGMLMSFAKIVKSKIRAGGKPTDGDKKLASRAKAELRRRRNVASKRMVESSDPAEYSERIKSLMQEFNVSSVDEMTEEQKAEFFSAI